jgi:CDP-diglyceride synthetase
VAGAAPNATADVDNYTTRIVKYVPAEVIAFYMAADKLFSEVKPPTEGNVIATIIFHHTWYFSLAVFVIGLIAVPLYLKATSDQGQAWGVHAAVSVVAFIIWTYASQGTVYNYEKLQFYTPQLAGLLILVFTLLAGFIVPGGSTAPASAPKPGP